jgi:hypothetical protein
MWWKKSSKNDKSSNEQAVTAVDDRPFDFERTLRELQERKEDLRPADAALFPEPLRSTLNFAIRIGKISLTDFAKMMRLDVSQARRLAELLMARKLFRFSPFSNNKEIFYEAGSASITRPLPRVGMKTGKG